MSFQFTLEKVLEVKDFEKTDAELAYTESVKHFEGVATKLYELLKRKEELILANERKLEKGLTISMIQLNEETISYLQKEIDHLQVNTQEARKRMNEKERYLTFKSIDLKKYEKMKEIKKTQYIENEKRTEQRFLDEISVQQFVRR
ncbi:flagellar export protein FliJ [Salipaludibacillus keqinensis]|jgi:flagellar protein FliJ|uniref:Flagellar FliJ protein n=1 Tax=Salipaludibacillus keqinensis TaxID=2045207 RepID=A0A323TUL5_9BACI|nr:flagellar export protein FliJ [Salipaludibacillus keqinensis]PYZ93145.1 flagellar export protein FliJ [Salipaludibacillus keqinensis]